MLFTGDLRKALFRITFPSVVFVLSYFHGCIQFHWESSPWPSCSKPGQANPGLT